MPSIKPQGAVQGVYFNTTNATPGIAAYFPTRNDAAYEGHFRITAFRTDGTAGVASYWRRAVFVNDGGTLTQVGSTQTIGTDVESAALAGADVAVAGSGENINVTVTGVAAINMTWNVSAEVQQIGQWADDGGLLTPQ